MGRRGMIQLRVWKQVAGYRLGKQAISVDIAFQNLETV